MPIFFAENAILTSLWIYFKLGTLQLANSLITPGHVHVLGILRGARERRGDAAPGIHHESTGNPMRDRELQRLAESRHFVRDDSRDDVDDEYAGLMSQRERQWIVNIQLSQLKCENPFLVRPLSFSWNAEKSSK
jgi:hypothetical protein